MLLCGAVAAQQNAAPSQSAPALAAIGPARPNRGNLVDKPAGAMPTVPPGFTVQVYAELQAPRMMVYAPNGDLFISSPAANNITVLRDVGQDGVFETRSVYAQGEAPAGRGGGGGPAAQPVIPGPQTPGESDGERSHPRSLRTRVRRTTSLRQPRTRHAGGALRPGIPG